MNVPGKTNWSHLCLRVLHYALAMVQFFYGFYNFFLHFSPSKFLFMQSSYISSYSTSIKCCHRHFSNTVLVSGIDCIFSRCDGRKIQFTGKRHTIHIDELIELI